MAKKMTDDARAALLAQLRERYEAFCGAGLRLDMSRGKPCPEQLALSADLLAAVGDIGDCIAPDGTDCRNYGCSSGLPELKALFAEILQAPQESVVIGGVSSLNLMYDTVARAMTHGLADSARPWGREERIKFICPVPGYDRHYTICAHFGIEMIPVPFTGEGPDMDAVERIAVADEAVKGIWCVPVYSNPTGDIYSDETIRRLANMPAKAKDFTVFYDNAYAVHSLYGERVRRVSFYEECRKAGNPERPILFASTSKITFAGGGVCCAAMGPRSLALADRSMSVQFLSHDKVNQLRHLRVLRDMPAIEARMARHAEIIRPKFELVERILTEELGDGAVWSKPRGGYFICLKLPKGTAKRTVQLCAEAGVKLTGAGAGFPGNIDPEDRYIRIAPTYPSLAQLETAARLLGVSARIAALEL